MKFFPPALDDRLYSYLQRHVNPLAFRLQQSPTRDYHPQIYHNNWHQDQVEPDSILHECIVLSRGTIMQVQVISGGVTHSVGESGDGTKTTGCFFHWESPLKFLSTEK